MDINSLIAKDTGLDAKRVGSTVSLLEEGNTVPFISRYRKEVTGNLTETEVRAVSEKYEFFKELQARKEYILQTIEKQERLTDELRNKIDNCYDRNELEDLYLPYKPKRRTKAQVAREAGFEPLAGIILAQELTAGDRQAIALEYANEEKSILSYEDIMEQALYIVAEEINHDSALRRDLRTHYIGEAIISSERKEDSADEKGIFLDYYEYSEPLKEIKSHRLLALNRGEKAGVLRISVDVDEDRVLSIIRKHIKKGNGGLFAEELDEGMELAYFAYLHPSLSNEVRTHYSEEAESVAIDVFERNLDSLLMGSPASDRNIMGIDPGLRTGSKIAILDRTGKYIASAVVKTLSESGLADAESRIRELVDKYGITLAAVGNGKGSKEMAAMVRRIMKSLKSEGRTLDMVIVNESGASIYSASPLAVKEFPDLDVTIRGAISIARRIHDPLSEFVKIDPKSLGVGQYQHDVDQKELKRRLDMVVTSVVNKVGADLNTASVPLLSYISGLSKKNAEEIVAYRDVNGGFNDLSQIRKIKGVGEKTFEQSAGFLRIRGGANPLDATSIHPERYSDVMMICENEGYELDRLLSDEDAVKAIDPSVYAASIGEYTFNDILEELKKPGRDVRSEFEPVPYDDTVESINDLSVGMVLPGVIGNITNFGMFVDLGVGVSGLCHISQAADTFVKDLNDVFRVGDRFDFTVIAVDLERQRISLSLKKAGAGRK